MQNIRMLLGPRIDFQNEGAKIVLYLVSPEGASMVDAGGENFVFLFSRTQEKAFLDTFSKKFVSVPQIFFCSAKTWRSHGLPPPPQLRGPCCTL